MNAARCDELDYIQFLVAAQRVFTCTEAARCQPASPQAPAHDAFTRLLRRQPPDTEALWREVRPLVQRKAGALVLDDTTLDKPYAKKMELVSRHWSGKHRRVVWGINLLTLLWTDGDALLPCDFRIYDKPLSGLIKNDYFRQMLTVAGQREFQAEYVLFDSWYAEPVQPESGAGSGLAVADPVADQPVGQPRRAGQREDRYAGVVRPRPGGASAGLRVGQGVS